VFERLLVCWLERRHVVGLVEAGFEFLHRGLDDCVGSLGDLLRTEVVLQRQVQSILPRVGAYFSVPRRR